MHVLISGAGIAGPTLSWFLAQAYIKSTIIEKDPAIRPHGQSVELQATALAAFKKTGLWPQVRARHTSEKGTQFVNGKGAPFALFPVREGLQASFTSAFEILRGDLADILYQATKEHPDVRYRFSTTITRVLENDARGVSVDFSDGSSGVFDLVVAADGQWSKVRAHVFDPATIAMRHKGMYGAYWTIPRVPSDNAWWNIHFALGRRIMALRPDPYGAVRVYITCMPGAAREKRWRAVARSDRQAQEDLVKQEFADAGWQAPRFLEGLEKAPDFYFQVVEQVRMQRWSSGRVVCIGDAAYAPTPLTGAGASLAVLGAYVLAGEISELMPGEHPSKALEAYETKFRPFVEETQKIPGVVPGIAHPRTKWQRWLLETGLACVAWLLGQSWIARWLRTEEAEDEGFPLPWYSKFEGLNGE
ncbi:FAD/NAD(P)-binding domain-containing protein [Karstenula rhodostoma CBS 690.94]|uniref:FAD/NAD(P)-binding domain-containing protein n=1 Tax=Karstenula rhodostoma CBS 690.94 TaxID=1392251 RepID=A0A9P4P7K4_9PLEO|nr:FAD/NAD(P)-binding domain-containing protein [Karstenula rhodostoma CBS 690.94]